MAESLVANASWYLVLKPALVLAADGSRQYEPAGVHTDLQQATLHAATIPGAAIVLNVCLFINPAVAAQPLRTAVPAA